MNAGDSERDTKLCERRRGKCVFITAVPITKLFARGEWRTCATRDYEQRQV